MKNEKNDQDARGRDGVTPVAGLTAAESFQRVGHTQTPWHVGPHYKSDIESKFGRVCECTPLSTPRSEANAAFIVRAVNAHDDLLASCKEMEEMLHLWMRDNTGQRELDVLERCEAAISKAEGRPHV